LKSARKIEFEKLQDQAPFVSFTEIHAQVCESFGAAPAVVANKIKHAIFLHDRGHD